MCRKFGGALIQYDSTFPTNLIAPPLASNPSYVEYESSETAVRGFCKKCGSSLTFITKGEGTTGILLGTVDEDILTSQVGTDLCDSKKNIWCANAVKGVSDKLPGEMRQTF